MKSFIKESALIFNQKFREGESFSNNPFGIFLFNYKSKICISWGDNSKNDFFIQLHGLIGNHQSTPIRLPNVDFLQYECISGKYAERLQQLPRCSYPDLGE